MQKYICDVCGGEINGASEGWVEWLSRRVGDKRECKGLRLVHGPQNGSRCMYSNDVYKNGKWMQADGHATDYVGPGGLMNLLSMIHEGDIDKEEVLELIKRLHIPGYEQARQYFDEAISEGVFEPNMPRGYYTQNDIKRTLEYIERKNSA